MLLKVSSIIICLLALEKEVSGAEIRAFPVTLEPNVRVVVIGEVWKFRGDSLSPRRYVEARRRHWLALDTEAKLALNSWMNKTWGQEEVSGLPSGVASKGKPMQAIQYLRYTMRITARDDDFLVHISLPYNSPFQKKACFWININGREYTFKYRMPKEDLGKLRFVVVDGNFDIIRSINFEKDG